jgi:hypothetical protein
MKAEGKAIVGVVGPFFEQYESLFYAPMAPGPKDVQIAVWFTTVSYALYINKLLLNEANRKGEFTMAATTTKVAEHHALAAQHHEKAAAHHQEASKHHEAGSVEKGAHHAQVAAGHAAHAEHHADEAAKAHAEHHGR